MLVIDIVSGDILEAVPARSKELWSITVFPKITKLTKSKSVHRIVDPRFQNL